MILFLDFDGVLHNSEVYVRGKRPYLRSEGVLFEHAERLIEEIAHRDDVRIVLSTSWVAHLGFDRANSFLPAELRRRVIGATYHRHAGLHKREWLVLSRYDQISSYVSRHRLVDWIAIDDDADGWPAAHRHHLVLCHNEETGLGDPNVFKQLRNALR